MELDFVDGMAVADVVLDAGLCGGLEDTDDAAGARYCEQRQQSLFFIRPGACVECFVYLDNSIQL